ncbi:MAG TPA: peptide chain release factor-like protein [Streptosporangiaceae bacterium]|nr:peptide chain release factor-like protein [Streptosporangiaceae bacterium]
MTRDLLFSVTMADCDLQTFHAGGKGGQNQNKTSSGVRIIHRASGAVGEARDQRSQWQNKRSAFRRMTETGKFRAWLNREIVLNGRDPEAEVRREMQPQNLLVEGRAGGKWQVIG